MAMTSVVPALLVVTLKAISTAGTPIVTGPINGLRPHQGEPMSTHQQDKPHTAFSLSQLNCHVQTSLSSFSVASQQNNTPLLSPRNGIQELAWDMADGELSSCSLTVHKTHPNVCFLSIFMEHFAVEPSEDCVDGWLEIDGEKLCGDVGDNVELSSKFSTGKQIIKFVNNKLFDPFFNLTIRQVNCKTKNQHESGELEALQTCSKQLEGDGFLLQSPNYPNLYPPYQDCVTQIYTTKNKLIIRFDEFFLEPSNDCSKDYFEVVDENPLTPNKKLCGSKTGYLQVDVTYSTKFVFHSDNQIGGRYSIYVETQDTSTQPSNGRTVSLETTLSPVTTEKSLTQTPVYRPPYSTPSPTNSPTQSRPPYHTQTPAYRPPYSPPSPTNSPAPPRPPYHTTESTLLHPCTQVFTAEPSLHSPNTVGKSVNTYQQQNVYRPPYTNKIGHKSNKGHQNVYRTFHKHKNVYSSKFQQQNVYRPPYNPCQIPQNVYRPPYGSTQNVYRPPYGSTQNIYRPPYGSTQNIYRSPYSTTQNIYRPVYSTTQDIYRPPYSTTQNIYRPPYSTTQDIYRPPYSTTQDIYRPPYNIDQNIEILSTVSTQRTTTQENAVIIERCGQGIESENCAQVDEDGPKESTTVTNVIPEENTENDTNIDIEYDDSINLYGDGSGDSVEEGNIPTPARF